MTDSRITPQRLFWPFVTLHLVLWTLVPALTSPNAPLDVIEGYAWGREWLIGTYKHPPMQAWWLEIISILTARASWAPFLASQLAVVAAFWAVWQTGRRLTDDMTSLLGVLLLEGAVYYNFTTPEFNPNVLQLPFWALACWSFHRAVKENRWYDWALLGLWGAGGLYTKYSTALLLAVLGLLMLVRPEARRRFASAGPYLALAVLSALIAPHLKWLAEHNFLPFTYAESRTNFAPDLAARIFYPVKFLMAQALSLLCLILLFLLLRPKRLTRGNRLLSQTTAFDRAFLHAVTFGPLVLLFTASLLLGFRPRDMWGACLWNFSGLWLVVFVANPSQKEIRRFAFGWGGVFVLGLLVLSVSNNIYPYLKGKGLRVHFPGRAMSEVITAKWRSNFHQPLAYVIGDTWLAGNIAYYTQGPFLERPHVIVGNNYKITTWATPKDVAKRGGVAVWWGNKGSNFTAAANIPPSIVKRFPNAVLQEPLSFVPQTEASLPPVVIGWCVIPPAAQ